MLIASPRFTKPGYSLPEVLYKWHRAIMGTGDLAIGTSVAMYFHVAHTVLTLSTYKKIKVNLKKISKK